MVSAIERLKQMRADKKNGKTRKGYMGKEFYTIPSLAEVKRNMMFRKQVATGREMADAVRDETIRHFVFDRPDIVFVKYLETVTYEVNIPKKDEDGIARRNMVMFQKAHVELSVPLVEYNRHRSKRLVKKMTQRHGTQTKILQLSAHSWEYIIKRILRQRKERHV